MKFPRQYGGDVTGANAIISRLVISDFPSSDSWRLLNKQIYLLNYAEVKENIDRESTILFRLS